MNLMAPLLITPRLDAKPWGGDRLQRFGLRLAGGAPLGEAVWTTGEGRLSRNGVALDDLIAGASRDVLGERGLAVTGGRTIFPLLVKLIDAAEDLSIQVHPDDPLAAAFNGVGKTEAWHVLDAEPHSVIFVGLLPGVTTDAFTTACRGGGEAMVAMLAALPAIPGTTILIPAGTIHALGAGVMVYEVQQPSDTTYRLWDWGRRGLDGHPRALHLDQGIEATRLDLRPATIAPLSISSDGAHRELLTACRYFGLERISLDSGHRMSVRAVGSPQVLTCLAGAGAVATLGGTEPVHKGDTLLLTAVAEAAEIQATSPLLLLRTWVPSLFDDIVRPARAAGYPDGLIAALAGPLDDVRQTIDGER